MLLLGVACVEPAEVLLGRVVVGVPENGVAIVAVGAVTKLLAAMGTELWTAVTICTALSVTPTLPHNCSLNASTSVKS